jgi:hypothetical protein
MRLISGRPLGVWLLSAVIGTEGLSQVGEAVQLLVSAPHEWVALATSGIIGCLLVFKAYRLWCFHRAAWLIVLIASAVGGITSAVEIVRGHAEPSTWLAVVWSATTVLYLSHPTVRALFAHDNRANST